MIRDVFGPWSVFPEFKFKNADRIVIFSDTDNDGQHDQRSVFWDKGDRLTGIELGFGGVWLTAPPYLLFIPDRNRDDQPDGPPEIVLDGFTLDAKHNFVNGLTWGPDGWLWGRHGILAESRPGVPGTPEAERPKLKCGIWRYHPTTKQFEVVAHGTTNPWGLDFDDHGQAFFSNNVIGHLWHLIPGARYKRMFGNDYNPHSYDLIEACSDHLHWTGSKWQEARGGEAHDQLGGGHSHSGGMIYLADNWPKSYRGTFFMNNIHGNRILGDTLHRQGSGYVGRCSGPFLRANDPWFRGISLKYGPDGGVFVTDWNDLGECHDHDGSYRSSGRLYKIIYGNNPSLPKFDLQAQSDFELAKLQGHSNEWYVRQSRRILQERATKRAIQPEAHSMLSELLSGHKSTPKRLRALWTLYTIGAMTNDRVLSLLSDRDEHIRYWAVRLATDHGRPDKTFSDAMIKSSRNEPSPLVRLAMAAALPHLEAERALSVAKHLSAFSEDATDANLPLMIWYGIEPHVEQHSGHALEIMGSTKIPVLRQYIARRLSTSSQPD